MPKVGDKAPPFRVTADDGQTVSLADYAGRNLILYFYPRASTPGCTHEAIEFRDLLKKFEALKTSIVGCSGDSVAAQAKFKAKYKLNFPLLADTEKEVIKGYETWRLKAFMGKKFLGVARTTFWIGPDGKIRKVWEKVTAKGHAADVLAAIQKG